MQPYTKSNPNTVRSLFSTIANQYDRGNAALSFSMHRLWNRALVKAIGTPQKLLDVCAGTGEIGFRYLKTQKEQKEVLLLDFCKEMLSHAELKARKLAENGSPHIVKTLEADAQKLPLPDTSYDAATIAYGVRNIHTPKKCFEEIFRVLTPNATFAILELTRPKNRLLAFGHKLYLKTLLPILGKVVSGNKQAYEYLSETIRTFASPELIKEELEAVGFKQVQVKPLFGGITTLIIAKKP